MAGLMLPGPQYLTNANPPAIVITALPAEPERDQRTNRGTFNRPMNPPASKPPSSSPAAERHVHLTNDDRSFPSTLPCRSTRRRITPCESGDGPGSNRATLTGTSTARAKVRPQTICLTFRFPIANDDFAAQAVTDFGFGQRQQSLCVSGSNEPRTSPAIALYGVGLASMTPRSRTAGSPSI
jgi:hypothetical protein